MSAGQWGKTTLGLRRALLDGTATAEQQRIAEYALCTLACALDTDADLGGYEGIVRRDLIAHAHREALVETARRDSEVTP